MIHPGRRLFSLAAALLATASAWRPAPVGAQQEPSPPPAAKVTLSLRDAPLRAALEQLFSGSGIGYAVAGDVPDVRLTLNLRDVTRDQALRTLVRLAAAQAPRLASDFEGEVHRIFLRAGDSAANAQESPSPPAPATGGTGIVWEKIPLRFASVFWVTPVLGGSFAPAGGDHPVGSPAGSGGILAQGPGGPAGAGPGGAGSPAGTRTGGLPPAGIESIVGLPTDNSLVVRGTPAAIAELKSFLRLIDIPGRQVSVTIYNPAMTTNINNFGIFGARIPFGSGGSLRLGGR